MGTELIELPSGLSEYADLVVNVARRQEHDVYIGRTSRGRHTEGWGNPAVLRSNSHKARLEAVSAFYDHLMADAELLARLHTLSGLRLGCWCSPKLCHGHILAAAAAGSDLLAGIIDTMKSEASAEPHRLLVTGSRSWTDSDAIMSALLAQWSAWGRPTDAILVVGGAQGADEIAETLWRKAGFPVERYEADWDAHGKKAGVLRNLAMIATGVDATLAFRVGASPGTSHCIEASRKAGIPVSIFER